MRRLSIFTKAHQIVQTNYINKHLFSLSSKKPTPTTMTAAAHISTATPASAVPARKKIVVIMGPTGCGKTKLSIDLASRFFPCSEIINSDKIQIYRGLDITTNKVSLPERKNVRHHLLGEFDSSESHPEFTPSDFRSSASRIISRIASRRRLPLVVGGSNSLVYALLAKKFNPESDVFADSAFCKELRYDCCFIWVDVSPTVLDQYLVKRVDDMLDTGMFDELSEYFDGIGSGRVEERGLNRAIGVPEFERYFRGTAAYEEAVGEVKDNTCRLAKRQVGKIRRLREGAGWEMNRVDTTASLRAAVEGSDRSAAADIWEKQVVEPSVKIVKQFLMK